MTTALAAMAVGLAVVWTGAPSPAAAAGKPTAVKAAAGKAATAKTARKTAAPKVEAPPAEPAEVARLAEWVSASGDNGDLPFMVIDKATAGVFVFEADGTLKGSAPALLGFARGDASAPGIGDRRLSAIRPRERTTPAGRFVAAYGWAYGHTKVLWIDYATAISLHPVVTTNPKEQRLRRLKSASAKDNRITYGCINVSAGFYEDVVRRTFTGTRGVVYILPESQPLDTVFPAFAATQASASAAAHSPADLEVARSHPAADEASDVALVDHPSP